MAAELQDLKFVRDADVYKAGILAGHLGRTGFGGVRFSYAEEYLAGNGPAVAVSLPLSAEAVETQEARCRRSSPGCCPRATGSRS